MYFGNRMLQYGWGEGGKGIPKMRGLSMFLLILTREALQEHYSTLVKVYVISKYGRLHLYHGIINQVYTLLVFSLSCFCIFRGFSKLILWWWIVPNFKMHRDRHSTLDLHFKQGSYFSFWCEFGAFAIIKPQNVGIIILFNFLLNLKACFTF